MIGDELRGEARNVTSRAPRVTSSAVIAAFVILTVAYAVPEYVLRQLVGRPAGWPRVFLGVAPHFLMWGVFAVAIDAIVRRFPIERRSLALRVAFYFLLGLVCYVVEGALSFWLLPRILHDPEVRPEVMRALFIRTFYDDFLLFWSIVGALHLLAFQRTRRELERAFARAQLEALRTQIQPHFLFNTLNAIAELLHSDTAAAERVLERLSSMLRQTLATGDRQEIALAEELRMLDAYLEIQQVRFGDSIAIERDIDADALEALVPPLVLQPLVENAFRHGFAKRRRDAKLRVIARAGDQLELEVLDNGAGLDGGWSEGIGIGNTRVRIERLYGGDASLVIEPRDGGGVRAAITLPRRSTRA